MSPRAFLSASAEPRTPEGRGQLRPPASTPSWRGGGGRGTRLSPSLSQGSALSQRTRLADSWTKAATPRDRRTDGDDITEVTGHLSTDCVKLGVKSLLALYSAL